MKVALAHDWLTNLGGAERVVQSFAVAYPKSPIFTSVYNREKLPQFEKYDVNTSFLQSWPLAKSKHQLFPTLRRLAFESFDLSEFDVVISSSSAEAKGIITPTETLHISYIHTPTRYYWSGYDEYLKNPGYGWLNPVIKLVMPWQVKKMRRWDYAAAQRPDVLLANSKVVQQRIKKYYGRPSIVLYPPVDMSRFDVKKSTDKGYFLVVSRLIPYKHIELAVKACTKLGHKLVVVGDGSERVNLQSIAGSNIEFTGALDDEKVTEYYQNCKAFIFSAEEDFGITPLEAMACGKPVIAYGRGGALETVVEGQTGLFFKDQTTKSLISAIKKFDSIKFENSKIAKHADKFNQDQFVKKLKSIVEGEVEKAKTKK